MSKYNFFLDIQTTKEKNQKEFEKKNIRLINSKYLKELNKNENNFQDILTHTNLKKIKFNFLDYNRIHSLAKKMLELKKNNIDSTNLDGKNEKDTSLESFYDVNQKQINIKKNNSVVFIKKRPNDFIKYFNLNRSTIVTKYSYSCSQKKEKCFSCTGIKNKPNLLNNETLTYLRDNITSTKKTFFHNVNTFEINDFSFKDNISLINRKSICDLISSLVKIMNKHLTSIKAFIFNKMKQKIIMNAYKVTIDEYKLLEELKLLGVTNKIELNLFLKDVYLEIKAKNYFV